MKKSVILFGATSYVGRFVIKRLLEDGYAVIAIGRNKVQAEILLCEFMDKIDFCSSSDLISSKKYNPGSFDAIINLAYIQDAPFEKLFSQNKQLCDAIHEVAVHFKIPKVFHTSTLSVFGYALPEKSAPEKVEMLWGDPYIETKIKAEHHLLSNQKKSNYSLAIIRLGNVLGPASPNWTAGLAAKILQGKPVGFTNEKGFSNSTYVKNIADYFIFLIGKSQEELNTFGAYHHLSEFHKYTWNEILEGYSKAVGMPLSFVAEFSPPVPGKRSLQGRVLSFAKKFQTGKKSGYARYWSSIFSNFGPVEKGIKKIKKNKSQQFHISSAPSIANEVGFLNTMCAENSFQLHTFPDWNPPFVLETAMKEMQDYLTESGFCFSV